MFWRNTVIGSSDQPSLPCMISTSANRVTSIEAKYASRHLIKSSAMPPLFAQTAMGTPSNGKPASSSPPLVAARRSIVKLFNVSANPSSGKVPGSSTMSFTP